jgi:Trans-aconitate methyltransferase
MINTAKKLERDNLVFICMDINDMDFVNQFDLVFSNAALHWVKNHQQLLQNSFASLKPNGMLVWNFAGDGNCAAFFDTVKKVMNMPSYQEFFSSFDWPWFMPKKEDYVVLVEKTGFKQFDVSYENADRYFSRDEMIKWIDQPSIVPFLNCIPENKKRSFT